MTSPTKFKTKSAQIARHDQLRDVLYEAAAGAALAPIKEAAHLLPGVAARPGDILIWRWVEGKDGALDVTVTGPLAQSNVEAAAAESGAALEKAFKRKVQGAAQACQDQGIDQGRSLWPPSSCSSGCQLP